MSNNKKADGYTSIITIYCKRIQKYIFYFNLTYFLFTHLALNWHFERKITVLGDNQFNKKDLNLHTNIKYTNSYTYNLIKYTYTKE